MAVGVGAGDVLTASPPVALFKACITSTAPDQVRYDVTSDGARSLWLCPSPRLAPSVVTVSLNWAAHLAERRR